MKHEQKRKGNYRVFTIHARTTSDFFTLSEVFDYIDGATLYGISTSVYHLEGVLGFDPKHDYVQEYYDQRERGCRVDFCKFMILDKFGEVVPKEVVFSAHIEKYFAVRREKLRIAMEERTALYDKRLTLRVKRKGSANKIKHSYSVVKTKYAYGSDRIMMRLIGYTRNVATLNEKKQNEAHCLEYGEVMVRARRRNLPDSWSDIRISGRNCDTSWKHNSKRRKQWKAKT